MKVLAGSILYIVLLAGLPGQAQPLDSSRWQLTPDQGIAWTVKSIESQRWKISAILQYNIRPVQHHAAQLNLLLRQE